MILTSIRSIQAAADWVRHDPLLHVQPGHCQAFQRSWSLDWTLAINEWLDISVNLDQQKFHIWYGLSDIVLK